MFACSVLVHSGGVHGGHYYAYIRPTLSDQWFVLYLFAVYESYLFVFYAFWHVFRGMQSNSFANLRLLCKQWHYIFLIAWFVVFPFFYSSLIVLLAVYDFVLNANSCGCLNLIILLCALNVCFLFLNSRFAHGIFYGYILGSSLTMNG